VGADALMDIAVLKIEAGRIPPAPLGTSSDLMVGEPAIAIGNPLGYFLANGEATVTAGVISGVSRDIRSEDNSGSLFADMIQTDAAINPGNSGGALVNAEGRVIGVNSSILSRSGGSEGLGFAIPIDRALRIADELKEFGRIRRPWIGVDPEIVASDTSLFSSTRIRRVAPDSPAEAAGLKAGDILVEINGRRIDSPLDLEVGLLDAGVDSRVQVRYARAGRETATMLPVLELPSDQAPRIEVLTGLELITVTPQIAIERSLPTEVDSGALIVMISDENSRFSGLRRGDVIVALNRKRVRSAEDADDLFRSFGGGGRIWATIVRDGRMMNTSSFRVR
jgi:serine protease Do